MDILKIDVQISESGEWKLCDAILVENHVWLVGRWLENKELELVKPERIIRLPESDIEPSPLPNHHLILKKQIALAVLHGEKINEYEVQESPDITISLNLVFPTHH